jgi:hypothetical protein
MLDAYPQFIAWQFVQRPGKPKPDKVPTDPQTGHPIDPHNPAHWRSRAEIEKTGYHVGFVLSDRDPFFFLDLDDCYDGTMWHPEAAYISTQLFPGFATEVSISGTGLHIMGVCDKSKLVNRRHKFTTPGRAPKDWLEFYTTKRFVALGQGLQGRFDLDGTDMLLKVVPQGNPNDDVDLTAGPAHGYTGPADDEELLRRMLTAGGSIGQHMGTKARIVDLWNGDASILCQLFPSPTDDAFDRSKADAALMFHLAFWTGKDAARMDRLFRRSALMRPKYADRMDYRRSTMQAAISSQQKIYDVLPATKPEPTADTDMTSDAEFLTVPEMQRLFQNCVYVRDHHSIMVPDGTLLKPDQFSATYGGHIFQLSSDMRASGTTKNAFEAFTQCRIHRFPQVKSIRFMPTEKPGAIIDDAVNTYVPANIVTEEGDITPFLDHVKRMLPDERDRTILLTYMIALVQNPGKKFQWAPVLQGTEGNGTSWLAKFITYAVGEKFCHKPKPEDITNKFNAWMIGKLFIEVQEITFDGRYEMIESIKDWITDDRVEGHAKGSNQFMIDNCANWFLATNHKNALPVTADTRRFAMLFTAQQSKADIVREGWFETDYFPKLWDWTRNGGLARVAHWLKTAQIPDERFNPAGAGMSRAPSTSSTAEAIAASMGNAEQYLMEAVNQCDLGFRGGWISSHMAEMVLVTKRINVTPQKLSRILTNLGYRKVDRSPIMIMEESSKRPVLYIRTDLYQNNLTVADYVTAQGYSSVTNATVLPLRKPGS